MGGHNKAPFDPPVVKDKTVCFAVAQEGSRTKLVAPAATCAELGVA